MLVGVQTGERLIVVQKETVSIAGEVYHRIEASGAQGTSRPVLAAGPEG